MRSRNARIVGAAALLATLLGACSSDGVTKDDFIEAADAACREADEAISELSAPRVEEGLNEYVEEATGIGEELVAALRDLDRPEGDQDPVERMIEGLEEAIALLDPLAQTILDEDQQALEELQQQAEQLTDEISEAAESYGFETCGGKVLNPTS